jgi:hypothetical protein
MQKKNISSLVVHAKKLPCIARSFKQSVQAATVDSAVSLEASSSHARWENFALSSCKREMTFMLFY